MYGLSLTEFTISFQHSLSALVGALLRFSVHISMKGLRNLLCLNLTPLWTLRILMPSPT